MTIELAIFGVVLFLGVRFVYYPMWKELVVGMSSNPEFSLSDLLKSVGLDLKLYAVWWLIVIGLILAFIFPFLR